MQVSASSVERIVSGFETIDGSELPKYSVDGITPIAAVVPRNVDEISEIMRKASDSEVSVTPWGGGTMMTLGNIPRRMDLVLLLRRLNRIVEYVPEDLTVTVEAGVKLADLQKVLLTKRQFLPLDPLGASSATLGGIAASNSFGARRYLYGGVKDLLLGIRMVHSDGSTTKVGGKVMKNVAGYDLRKLYVGSLGTLGIIAQTTFKVYPLPVFEATVISAFPSLEGLARTAQEVLMTTHTSVGIGTFAVEGFDPHSSRVLHGAGFDLPEGYVMAVGVQAIERKSLETRLLEIEKVTQKHGTTSSHTLEGERHEGLWNKVQEFPTLVPAKERFLVRCKVSTVISKVTEVMSFSREIAEKQNLSLFVTAHMGLGILHLYMNSERTDGLVKVISEVRTRALQDGGSLVVEAAPPEVKREIDVWGPVRHDFPIMRSIKDRFDPKGILNPGRFVGGI